MFAPSALFCVSVDVFLLVVVTTSVVRLSLLKTVEVLQSRPQVSHGGVTPTSGYFCQLC